MTERNKMNHLKFRDPLLASILGFALFARLVFLMVYPDVYFPDATSYKQMGDQIFAGKKIVNDIYMPLYPIWAYLTGGGLTQKLADITISTGIVFLIYKLSFTLFDNRLTSLVASTIAAIYPLFLFNAITGLTETSFTFLLLIAFWFLYLDRFLVGVVVLVLATLIRPTLDIFNPILIIIFTLFVHSKGWKQLIKNLGIYFVVYAILMSPWWIHQYKKYGRFVHLNLGDGIVIYAGNNPLNQSGGGTNSEEIDLSLFNKIKDPLLRNKALKQAAVDYIVQNPGHFIYMAGVKFIRFWRLYPYVQGYQQWYVMLTSILSYGVVLVLAIGFLIKNLKKYQLYLLPIFGLIAYLSLVHMITVGSIRYRFPLEPFLIIFAARFLINKYENTYLIKKLNDKISFTEK